MIYYYMCDSVVVFRVKMWDQVQTEFAGDETTNFGPRKETGTALYQVDTIATISTQNQVKDLSCCIMLLLPVVFFVCVFGG